jgi:hypothetical protein
VVVPVTKTWEELAKEAGGDSELAKKLDGIAEGERASMGGLVDAETTYREWMAEQKPKEAKESHESRAKDDSQVDPEAFANWFDPLETKAKILWEQYHNEMEVRRRMPKEMFVIDGLSSAIQEKLDTTADSLFFSADGVAKQVLHHPDMKAQEYVGVLNKINDCKSDYIYTVKDQKVGLLLYNGDWYKVILKTANNQTETYVVSMFWLSEKDYKKELAIIEKLKRATAKQ